MKHDELFYPGGEPIPINPPPENPQHNDCGILPPPIPPVRYIPGMNVQEQMNNMADRVNICINRWNQIQRECYQALDRVVGAASDNDVYYNQNDVKYNEGYSEDAGCSYYIVEAKPVDASGKPIFCHLRPAYNNITNNGARENISDVSFVSSGQMVMTAIQATETHWAGTTVFNSDPGQSTPDENVWVCGWNRNGVLRFFRGNVELSTLRQNRMVNCIGPVYPVVKDSQLFDEVLSSMSETPGSIQAMGFKPNGNKVFFSCGVYDQPGMTPTQVAKVFQRFGCSTAVITSYQTEAVTAWDATPIAENDGNNNIAEDVISVPGMTGGMTFLGKLVNAPIQWSIPQNCATWVISKRPPRGWNNAFTSEVANVIQKLGNVENSMSSLMSQFQNQSDGISEIKTELIKTNSELSELSETVNTFENRISELEKEISSIKEEIDGLPEKLNEEITTRETQYQELKEADKQEADQRKADFANIQSQLTGEIAERKSADTQLQNNIDNEQSARIQGDAQLQAAISNEASARKIADQALDTRIDTAEAKTTQVKSDLQAEIDDINSGKSLPIATTTKAGIVKIGNGLNISDDGTITTNGGGSGDSITEGTGITIETTPDGKKQISVNTDEIATQEDIDNLSGDITSAQNAITQAQTDITEQETKISGLQEDTTAIKNDVDNNKTDIEELKGKVDDNTSDINTLKTGEGLPVASSTTFGVVKIGANLSISEDGTLSASGGEGGSGETVAQGFGIEVEHSTETGVATVGLNATVRDQLSSIESKAGIEDVEKIENDLNATNTNVSNNTTEINAIKEDNTATKEKVEDNETAISVLNTDVSAMKTDIEGLKDFEEDQTAKNNVINQDIATAQSSADTAQSSANSAYALAQAAQTTASGKVNKQGDTMTGNLKLQGAKLLLADATGNIIGEIGANGDKLVLNGSDLGNIIVSGIASPTASADAANKEYVDNSVSPAITAANNANTAATAANQLATTANGTANQAKNTADQALAKADEIDPDLFLKLIGGIMTGTIGFDINQYVAGSGSTLIRAFYNNAQVGLNAIFPEGSVPYLKVYRDWYDEDLISPQPVQIKGVATPTDNSDAVNKAYVDKASSPKQKSRLECPSGTYKTRTINSPNSINFIFFTISDISMKLSSFSGIILMDYPNEHLIVNLEDATKIASIAYNNTSQTVSIYNALGASFYINIYTF